MKSKKINMKLDVDEIEMIRFMLGIYNTKNEVEEAKVKKLYAKFCDLSDLN